MDSVWDLCVCVIGSFKKNGDLFLICRPCLFFNDDLLRQTLICIFTPLIFRLNKPISNHQLLRRTRRGEEWRGCGRCRTTHFSSF